MVFNPVKVWQNFKTGNTPLDAEGLNEMQVLLEESAVNSPALQGTPTTPTPPESSEDQQIAPTGWVANAVSVLRAALISLLEDERTERKTEGSALSEAITTETKARAEEGALKAGINSPTFAGPVTVENIVSATNSTAVGNSAFVHTLVGEERTRAEAAEGEAVKLTGGQTVAGIKAFSESPTGPEPTTGGQFGTKRYIDGASQGLSPREEAALATTGALPESKYVGGVITAEHNEALKVDATAVSLNQRIIVKNQATEGDNGIYVVTHTGGAGEKWVLTRSKDMETAEQVKGAYLEVGGGETLGGTSWFVEGAGPWTVGTTPVIWKKLSSSLVYTAGTGLTKTALQFSANFGTTGGTVAQGNDSRIAGAAQTTGAIFTGPITLPAVVKTTNTNTAATAKMVQERAEEVEANGKLSPYNLQKAAEYTVLASDVGKTVALETNSGVGLVKIPSLPAGSVLMIRQAGSAQVEALPASGSGVTIEVPEGLERITRAKLSTIMVHYETSTLVVLAGDLGGS